MINITLLGLLTLVVGYQLFQNRKDYSPRQRTLKWALHIGLIGVLALLMYSPKSKLVSEKVMVYEAPLNLEKWKDSLGIKKAIKLKTFLENPQKYTEVVYVGKGLKWNQLAALNPNQIQWIPYFPEDSVQNLHYANVLQKGEVQNIFGEIRVEKPQTLKLVWGSVGLDSVELKTGHQTFHLKTQATIEGENHFNLVLNNKPLQTVAFFVLPQRSLNIQIIQDSPQFEEKVLAEWLGEQGHRVEMRTAVAQANVHQTKINDSKQAKKTDLLITSAQNSSSKWVKTQVAQGEGVLLLAANQVANINKELGTSFQISKISNEAVVEADKGIFTSPYRFVSSVAYQVLGAKPYVAVQRKVGVSLIEESYPLKLSGDSLGYSQLWNSILSQFYSADSNRVYIDGPIYAKCNKEVLINPAYNPNQWIKINADTLYLGISKVNDLSQWGNYTFNQVGWNTINDSLKVYVHPENGFQTMLQWKKSNVYKKAFSQEQAWNPWIYYILLVFLFTCIWVEPKFKY